MNLITDIEWLNFVSRKVAINEEQHNFSSENMSGVHFFVFELLEYWVKCGSSNLFCLYEKNVKYAFYLYPGAKNMK